MDMMEQKVNALFVYDGSRLLEPLAEVIGLPIDQANFVICQLVALVLGYFYRTYLGPQNVSANTRHWIQVIVGLSITYFCFGSQILHLFLQTFVCYILLLTMRLGVMEKAVFMVAMGYLATCHIYRVLYDYGAYTLDITGVMMVNTQRLACLAFSLKDGSVGDQSKLSPTMKYHATKRWPNLLEFASYIFCFSTSVCGPFCFYKDYIKFIEGTYYDEQDDDKKDGANNKREPPSPTIAMWKALAWTLVSGAVMFLLIPKYPVEYMKGEAFENMSFFQKNYYIVFSTTLMRYKYYFAWMLGEAVNLNSGLGYNGRSSDGKHKWDLLNNAEILNVELSSSLKVLLDNWNKTTTYWLRYVVYERVHSTLAVFFVSAFWHGFYLGYYLTFLPGMFFVTTARMVRRKIRPLFQSSWISARFYDCITFLATRLAISYLVFPFVILEFWPTWKIYKSMYYWYHIVVACAMIIIPLLPIKSERSSERHEKKAQ